MKYNQRTQMHEKGIHVCMVSLNGIIESIVVILILKWENVL